MSDSRQPNGALVYQINFIGFWWKYEKEVCYFILIQLVLLIYKDGESHRINAQLLTFDKDGFGGTITSTVDPYTILESTIYTPFVNAVVKYFAFHNISRVAPVAPFSACFDSNPPYGYSPLGPFAPDIEFVMENKNEVWAMYGSNVMVEVSKGVLCLAFVEGVPRHIRPSIVIGAHQLEDNLLQFDLASSRLAFSGPLRMENVACGNYVPTL